MKPKPDERKRRRLRILRHARGRWVSLTPLIAEIHKATLYRDDEALIRDGYLEKQGDLRHTTPAGEQLLDAEEGAKTDEGDTLARAIPALALIPIPAYRAIATLILAAIVAKRDQVRQDHYPFFGVFGPTMRLKTWLAKILCTILGLDPVHAIVLMPAESGRSLFLRRNHKGKIVSRRAALDFPLLVLDEFRATDPDTRRLCMVLLQGDLEVAFENDTEKIAAITYLTLNPKEGETPEEILGLTEAQLRRGVIADAAKIVIPPDLGIRAEEIIEEARKLGPLTLPHHRRDCSDRKKEIFIALQTCLKPEHLRTDVDMVALTATGLTGWLPPDQAVHQALHCHLLVAETQGHTREGWREAFSALSPTVPSPRPQASRASPGLREQVLQVLNTPAENPLDLDLQVQRLRGRLEAAGALGDVERFIQLHRELEALGVAPLVRQMGASPKEVRDALETHRGLVQLGFQPQDALAVAAALGNDPGARAEAIGRITRLLRSHGDLQRAIRSLQEVLADLRGQEAQLQQSLQGLKGDVETVERRRQWLQSSVGGLKTQKERLRAEIWGLQQKSAQLQTALDRLTQQVSVALGVKDSMEEVRRALAELEARKARTETELGALKAKIAQEVSQLSERARQIQVRHELAEDLLAWLLQGHLPKSPSFWREMDALRNIATGKAASPKPFIKSISDRVCKQWVVLLKEMVGGEIVSREELDAWKASCQKEIKERLEAKHDARIRRAGDLVQESERIVAEAKALKRQLDYKLAPPIAEQ